MTVFSGVTIGPVTATATTGTRVTVTVDGIAAAAAVTGIGGMIGAAADAANPAGAERMTAAVGVGIGVSRRLLITY